MFISRRRFPFAIEILVRRNETQMVNNIFD